MPSACDSNYLIQGGQCLVDPGIFNIYFKQDYQHRSVGAYTDSMKKSDFSGVKWGYHNERVEIEDEAGNKFMKNFLDAGKKGLTQSGLDWYMDLPDKTQDELYVAVRMKFSNNMATEYEADSSGKTVHWLSGKAVIGLYTNKGWGGAGTKPGPDQGFFLLLMFDSGASTTHDKLRTKFYVYDQNMACTNNCNDSDPSNDVYWGASYDTKYLFSPNVWYDVTYRIVLNDPGLNNGVLEYFVNGKLTAGYYSFRFRDTAAVRIDQLDFANFLGGSGTVPKLNGWWAFDDIVIFNFNKKAQGVPAGTAVSPTGRVVLRP